MATLSRLLQRLCDAEVEFVIVGGFAALLHGSTLVTRDLDICEALGREKDLLAAKELRAIREKLKKT